MNYSIIKPDKHIIDLPKCNVASTYVIVMCGNGWQLTYILDEAVKVIQYLKYSTNVFMGYEKNMCMGALAIFQFIFILNIH